MNSSPSTSRLMRILVADHQCEQRIVVEKSLGLLGYFRVCPAVSFRELTAFTHYSPSLYERFDLLILNADLVSSAGINVLDFCVNNPRFRHVLIYGSSCGQGRTKMLSDPSPYQVRLVDTISYEALVDFFSLINKSFSGKSINPPPTCSA